MINNQEEVIYDFKIHETKFNRTNGKHKQAHNISW